MSINQHIHLSLSISSANTARATFGRAMFVCDHEVGSARQHGPYTSMAAVIAAGFTLTDEPVAYAWANTWFSQRPRGAEIMFGRWTHASESLVVALDAIEAVDPATFYAVMIDSRNGADLMALATWVASRSKISGGQSSSAAMLAGTPSTAQQRDITVGGTATDGDYVTTVRNRWTGALVATVTTTRAAGTPATLALIAAAHAAALEANTALAALTSPIAAVGAVISVDFTALGNSYTFEHTAPAPATMTSADNPAQTINPGELMDAGAFDRSWLVYHDDDTEYLDAAIMAKCLGFALDRPNGAGNWAYQRITGVSATRLTDPQKTELVDVNVNYYSPVRYTSGVEEDGFFFPGVMTSGRFIDITTTLDLTQARMEEAGMGVFLLAASSSSPRVPYTDDGIALFDGAFSRVAGNLVKAGHYAANAVSPVSGAITPIINVPLISEVDPVDKAARRLILDGELVLAGAINSVGDEATVGFSINVSL